MKDCLDCGDTTCPRRGVKDHFSINAKCYKADQRPQASCEAVSAELPSSIPLQDVAEKVCEHLPEGYILHLCMENGAAWVSLTDNRNGCKVIDIDGADQTLYEQINAALCIAKGFKE